MKNNQNSLAVFENFKIRRYYNEQSETWYFSVIDIVAVLTEQKDYRKAKSYWTTLKSRLKNEESEVVTKCDHLKMLAQDGKMRETDVANVETLLRLVQSVPSKKGGKIAKDPRIALENKIGKSVVTGENFLKSKQRKESLG